MISENTTSEQSFRLIKITYERWSPKCVGWRYAKCSKLGSLTYFWLINYVMFQMGILWMLNVIELFMIILWALHKWENFCVLFITFNSTHISPM